MIRTRNTVALRALRGLALGTALVVGAAATASAQVTFIGSTQFQFNGVGGFANSTSYHGLTFNTGTFTVVTNAPGDTQGFNGSNNGGTAVATPTGFNFGAGGGTTIQMLISFLSPTAGPQTFSALVTGNIISSLNGPVVSWSPSTISNIPFTIAPYTSGTFSIAMNNMSVTANGTAAPVNGFITENTFATPEPASMVLLGTGLLGVFGAARRRRKA